MSGRGKSKGKSSEMGTFLLNSESSRKSMGLVQSVYGESYCRK